MRAETKRQKTREANKMAKKWLEERTPLKDSYGKTYKFTKRERIVPLYDYRSHKLNKRYYVTDRGVIISFQQSEPTVIHQVQENGYCKFSTSENPLYVHRAVWFSFAYDALINGTELPLTYQIKVETLKDLKKITSDIEVNHIKGRSNKLSNLRLMEQPLNLLLRNLFNFTLE